MDEEHQNDNEQPPPSQVNEEHIEENLPIPSQENVPASAASDAPVVSHTEHPYHGWEEEPFHPNYQWDHYPGAFANLQYPFFGMMSVPLTEGVTVPSEELPNPFPGNTSASLTVPLSKRGRDAEEKVEGSGKRARNELPDDSTLAQQLADVRRKHGELQRHMMCKVCWDREVDMMFLPCRHVVVCEHCYKTVVNKKGKVRRCPVCQQRITKAQKFIIP